MSKQPPMKHPTLAETVVFAVNAHAEQVDKVGRPYFWHLFEVARRVYDAAPVDEALQHVAFLHDIVEDGHATLAELRARGYSETIVTCVDALTRRKGEEYRAFVERIKASSPESVLVKHCDLAANMARLSFIEDTDTRWRLRMKYEDAFMRLGRREHGLTG